MHGYAAKKRRLTTLNTLLAAKPRLKYGWLRFNTFLSIRIYHSAFRVISHKPYMPTCKQHTAQKSFRQAPIQSRFMPFCQECREILALYVADTMLHTFQNCSQPKRRALTCLLSSSIRCFNFFRLSIYALSVKMIPTSNPKITIARAYDRKRYSSLPYKV